MVTGELVECHFRQTADPEKNFHPHQASTNQVANTDPAEGREMLLHPETISPLPLCRYTKSESNRFRVEYSEKQRFVLPLEARYSQKRI